MTHQNQLVVIDGPEQGERFNLRSGTFRFLGRGDR